MIQFIMLSLQTLTFIQLVKENGRGLKAMNNLAIGLTPSPRAAHACTSVDVNQMILYGGASGGSH